MVVVVETAEAAAAQQHFDPDLELMLETQQLLTFLFVSSEGHFPSVGLFLWQQAVGR